jgi:hypothetical protein
MSFAAIIFSGWIDLDGNQTSDGLRTDSWEGENRLLSMQSSAAVPSGARNKLDFTYDWQSRRIQKVSPLGTARPTRGSPPTASFTMGVTCS